MGKRKVFFENTHFFFQWGDYSESAAHNQTFHEFITNRDDTFWVTTDKSLPVATLVTQISKQVEIYGVTRESSEAPDKGKTYVKEAQSH